MTSKRERYTPTDIGPSPSTWHDPFLGKVAPFISNGFVGTATPYYSHENDEGAVKYLYGMNVRANKIDRRGLRHITNEFHQSQAKTELRTGDLLMVQSGHIGTVAMVPEDLDGANCHALIISRLDQTKADPRFLSQYLNSEIGVARLRGLEVGSTIMHINTKDLKKFRVPIPPLPEQRKIADILSTWDAAIEKTEALLATAKAQKRALMQSLLTGKRRFPDFEGQPWKEVRLRETGTTVSGGTPDSTVASNWDGDIHWATPTDITKLTSRFIRKTARMITESGLKGSSAKLVPSGTILICTRATIGEMAIATGPICTNQGFKNLVLSDAFDSDFIFYLLQFFKKDLIRYACGSTFLELSKKDFDKRSFLMPELGEQRRIAAVLNDAEDQIAEHAQSIIKLRTEKKALMQQLLTGKRRVVVDA